MQCFLIIHSVINTTYVGKNHLHPEYINSSLRRLLSFDVNNIEILVTSDDDNIVFIKESLYVGHELVLNCIMMCL